MPFPVLVALTADDVPGGNDLLVHSCEDCACPASRARGTRPARPPLPDGELVLARDVCRRRLDDGYSVLFGPGGNGGAVVVNEGTMSVVDRLAAPASIPDLATATGADPRDLGAVLRRLGEHDLVHGAADAAPAPEFAPSTELTVWFHVTNACNLRCPYCYVHKSADAMDEATARTVLDAVIRSAVAHGFESVRLKYAGGEASLNSAVLLTLHDHAVARCAENGLALSSVLLSNGVAISRRLASELAARSIAVMISLDGLGASHDVQRPTVSGRPSSTMVLRSIDRLVDAGIGPHLSVTLTSRNVDGAEQVARFALEHELTFSFNFFRDNDCATGVDDLSYDEATMIAGLRRAFAVIEENLPIWSVLGAVLDRGQLVRPRRKACGVGDDYVVVDQHGRIAQCHMDLSATLGDARAVDPVRAVRSATGIRNLLVDDKVGCRSCTWRHWCAGGCAVATVRATGRFDVRSPNCTIYRTIYPEALELEGKRILKYARAVPS